MTSFNERVLQAFQGIRLPDKLFALDTTETLEIEAALRPFDNWTDIPPELIENFASALTLAEPGAFQFLLPAFMLYGTSFSPEEDDDAVCSGFIAATREPAFEGLWRKRLATLTRPQRSLLLEYLTEKSNMDKFSLAAVARSLAARLIEELDAGDA